MKCIIAHEVSLGNGRFNHFLYGIDYPELETKGREMYFESVEVKKPRQKVVEKIEDEGGLYDDTN
jgi:hypothetical protein